MVRNSSAILAGAILLCAGAGSAMAADLYGRYGGMKDTYAPMPVAATSPSPGVYFRIDGTYGSYDDPIMVENGIYDLKHETIDNSWGFGGGIGYYFNEAIRGDITVERRFDAEARGTLLDVNTGMAGVRKFDLESTMVLFNLYYDFDMRSRFTPYIGIGLGYAHNKTKNGTVEALDGSGTIGTVQGAGKDSVAAALMAGTSIALLDRLSLDVGYRFLYLGDGTTGPVVVPGGSSQDPTVEDLHVHEVKFGLRYDWN